MFDNPAVPACNGDDLERIAGSRLMAFWVLRTPHSLKDVLAPGYFQPVTGHGLRASDRIEVAASVEGAPEHATLFVASTDPELGAIVGVLAGAPRK